MKPIQSPAERRSQGTTLRRRTSRQGQMYQATEQPSVQAMSSWLRTIRKLKSYFEPRHGVDVAIQQARDLWR